MSVADPVVTPNSGNVWLEGILWGDEWSDAGGTVEIQTYIAGMHGNEVVNFGGRNVTAFTPYTEELVAILNAMKSFEAVCGIRFINGSSQSSADLIWSMVSDADALGALGIASPPGEYFHPTINDWQSGVIVNGTAYNPNFPDANLLAKGGFDYYTFIHELGHAVGMAHPHDTGGGSTVFPGVDAPFGDYGDHEMNQGIFTFMSYNQGWATAPHGASTAPTYGNAGGPMALDIAALQFMYGKNMSYNTGANTYALPESNQVGTFYQCIWDAGGSDTIVGATKLANTIDLRAATLQNAPGGGGFVSFAAGIHGGFTIANTVVIENAIGGDMNDTIAGNNTLNVLRGNEGVDNIAGAFGNDKVRGNDGNDTLRGDEGADDLSGGEGLDIIYGGPQSDNFFYNSLSDSLPAIPDRVQDFVSGGDKLVLSVIDANQIAGGNQAFNYIGGAAFSGVAGQLRSLVSAPGNLTFIQGDVNGDKLADMIIRLENTLGVALGDFVL